MVVANFWSVKDILDYLSEYGGTIRLRDNKPYLHLDSYPVNRWGKVVNRKKLVDEILPHLLGRREELLEYLDPDARENKARRLRRAVFLDVTRRAAAGIVLDRDGKEGEPSGTPRAVWWLGITPKGAPVQGSAADVPDAATFVCVEGDFRWTPIVPIPPRVGGPLSRKPVRRRRKRKL